MHDELTANRIAQIPAPAAKEPGWYPDPLGSTRERYWDGSWLELTRVPEVRLARPVAIPNGNGQPPKKSLLSRVGLKPAAPVEAGATGPADKAGRKRSREAAERKREFFASPAGRARLSYGQKHDVFQCHLPLTRSELVVIPGVVGTAPLITSDPVQILNSVVAEGWKLKAGSFFWADADGGVVGYYMFKRSPKRHRKMNDPWKGEPEELR
ncbi:MAG: DUF2510 domain-containing protein [Actinobacteria bacterium]|nr:DUF2510 domain-containing protein [Actinomycetota bacterium]